MNYITLTLSTYTTLYCFN